MSDIVVSATIAADNSDLRQKVDDSIADLKRLGEPINIEAQLKRDKLDAELQSLRAAPVELLVHVNFEAIGNQISQLAGQFGAPGELRIEPVVTPQLDEARQAIATLGNQEIPVRLVPDTSQVETAVAAAAEAGAVAAAPTINAVDDAAAAEAAVAESIAATGDTYTPAPAFGRSVLEAGAGGALATDGSDGIDKSEIAAELAAQVRAETVGGNGAPPRPPTSPPVARAEPPEPEETPTIQIPSARPAKAAKEPKPAKPSKNYDPTSSLSRLATGTVVVRDVLRTTRGLADYSNQMAAAGSNVRAQYEAQSQLQKTVEGGVLGEVAGLIIDPTGSKADVAKAAVDSADAIDAQTKGAQAAFEQRRGFEQQAQLEETSNPFDRERLQAGFEKEKELEAARTELKTRNEQAIDVQTHERAEAQDKYTNRIDRIQYGDPEAFKDSAGKTLSRSGAFADAEEDLHHEQRQADNARNESVRKNVVALDESTAAITAGSKAELNRIGAAERAAGMRDENTIEAEKADLRGDPVAAAKARAQSENTAERDEVEQHYGPEAAAAWQKSIGDPRLRRAEADAQSNTNVESFNADQSVKDFDEKAKEATLSASGNTREAETARVRAEADKQIAILQDRYGNETKLIKKTNDLKELNAAKVDLPKVVAANDATNARIDIESAADVKSETSALNAQTAGDDAKARRIRREQQASDEERAAKRAGHPEDEAAIKDREKAEQRADDKKENRIYSDRADTAEENVERSQGLNQKADESELVREVKRMKDNADGDPGRLKDVDRYEAAQQQLIREKDNQPQIFTGRDAGSEVWREQELDIVKSGGLGEKAGAKQSPVTPALPNIFGPGGNMVNPTLPIMRTVLPNPHDNDLVGSVPRKFDITAMGHPIQDDPHKTALGHPIGTGDEISEAAKAANAKLHEHDPVKVEAKPAPRRPDPALHSPGSSLDDHKPDDRPDSISEYRASHPKTPDYKDYVPTFHVPAEFQVGYTGPSSAHYSDDGHAQKSSASAEKFDGVVSEFKEVVGLMHTVLGNVKELYVLDK